MANKAIVGEKVGMTQVWDDANRVVPVTVVSVRPCRVVQVKTPSTDGYGALQVTYGTRAARKLTKAAAGHYAKNGVEPGERLVELRLDDPSGYEVGQELGAGAGGGGATPGRQRAPGRARQGSIRSPQWRGGGVALGPKPRSYRQRTPKKMVQLALRSALSDRAAEGKVAVVSRWDFAAPKTREARLALSALGVDGRALVVLGPEDEVAAKSFRNLPEVHVLAVGELNAYDVLCSDWVIFTEATLPRPSAVEDGA